MSTNVEDRTAKSKKTAVKVGGEFSGIAGIAVVGVVAVGIAAGVIAFLKNRHTNSNRKQLNKDENHQISSKKSAEICPSPNPNECFGREEAELIAPSSENGEETELDVEIVESLSDLDVSPDWKDMNKSKEEGSPRSHFSRKTSIASTSSDSEDFSESSRNNYIRDSEIDSSRMNLKEGDFYFVTAEETAGKEASSHLRECVPDNEVHISSVKQSMDPKIEYEESVDSCDGLQEECEEVGSFVELGGSVAEHVGEQKLAVFDGWEVMEESQCILDCTQKDGTVIGTVMENGNREKNRVGLEEDGGSLCIEQVHVPLKGDNTNVSEDLQRKDVAYEEIGSMQNYEALKEDVCLEEKETQLQNFNSEQDIALFKEEQLENIGSSEVLNCHEEEHSDGPKNDTVVANEDMLLCNAQCLQEENFGLNVEQCSQERTDSEQLEDFKDNVAQKGEPYQCGTVDSSHFEGLDCMVDQVDTGEVFQHQSVDSRDFEDLDYKRAASRSDENGQHGKLKEVESKDIHSPIKEERQHEPVAFKELEGTEIYVNDYQEGPENDTVIANEEMLLCKEQCLQDEKCELNVEQFSQERTDSEESDGCKDNKAHKDLDCSSNFEDLDYKEGVCHSDYSQHEESDDLKENIYPINEQSSSEKNQSKELICSEADMRYHQNEQNDIVLDEHFVQEEEFDSNVDLCLQERFESEDLEEGKEDKVHKVEQYDDETFGSKHLGTTSHHDEIDRHGELEDSEEALKCADHVDSHVHQDRHKNEIVVADEELLLCKEQCLQEENLESNIEQCLQERTDSEEELENCMVDLANNGEQCQYETVISKDFESSDYKEGCSYWDEKGQNGEVQELEEHFGQIKEQIQQETVKEIECTADNIHIHCNGQQNSVVDANEKVLLCKEECPEVEKFEYNVENHLQERTELEEVENCKLNEAHNGDECHYDGIDSNDFEILDHNECESHADEICQNKEIVDSEQYFSPHKEQFQEETVRDGHQNQIVSTYEQVVLNKEQRLTESTFESHSENWQQEMADSEELENLKVDVAHEGKQCHLEAIDSSEFLALGEGVSHENGSCQYGEINSKDFEGFDEGNAKEQSESDRVNSKEDVDKDNSSENNLHLRKENSKQSLETIEDMSDMDAHCEESITDSNEKEDNEGDALICKEEHQEETLHSIYSKTFVQDELIENQGSKELISKFEDQDLTEEVVPIIQEHSQKETVDSIDKLDSIEDLPLKSKQNERKMSEFEEVDNLHISGDDMSDMDVQGEESNIDSNEKEGKEGDALICKEEYQEESLDSIDSQTFVQDAHVENQGSEEIISKFEELYSTEEVVSVIQEHSQKETADSIDKLDSVEDLSLKSKQYQRKMSDSEVVDNLHISGEDMSDMDVQCEESTIDSNEKEDKEGDSLICQEESLDSIDSQTFVQDAHVESQGSEEVINKFEEPDLAEEIVPSSQDHSQRETDNSIDKLDSVEESSIDSNEKEDEEGDALICKEEYQEESLDSIDSQTFVQDAHVENQGSEEIISKFEELDSTEEVVPIIQEHSQKETADSIDKLDSAEDFSLKSKQYQRKMSDSEVVDNLHISGEDMSDMDVQCEESTIDSNEKEDKEGDSLICQEESLDSIDSQTFVQDAHVESQGSEEVISKFEEPDLTEEIVPSSQEHSQKETANSIDKLDSVEDLSLKNKQYERKMSESQVLNNLHISGEECKENTTDLEVLEQSENVHLSMEQCQQNIVDPEETIDLENVNQYKQCQRVDVNGKEPEFSISNVFIPKGLCPNEIVDPKDLDNEDPQTKPKEVDANESEYSSGDTHCFEKYEQETTDKAANEDYKQDPEDSPELEEVHTDNSENSSTDTHCRNGKKEVNQNTSTTIVSESCKLVGFSKEIQVHKESTDNEIDTVMKSESGAVANPFSVTKRVKSGCDPSHPPQLDSTAEEAKSHLAQFPRNLTTRIKITVCLFAFSAFLFLFASKLARISISEDTI